MNNFSEANTTLPKVNVKEDPDGFLVEMAAPGMTKDDFNIEVNNNLLTISSEKHETNKEADNGKYTKREFAYAAFQRSFSLPDSANTDNISAKYDNGILKLSIPKKEEAKPVPPRKIDIS
jgi:HSP20 family protein